MSINRGSIRLYPHCGCNGGGRNTAETAPSVVKASYGELAEQTTSPFTVPITFSEAVTGVMKRKFKFSGNTTGWDFTLSDDTEGTTRTLTFTLKGRQQGSFLMWYEGTVMVGTEEREIADNQTLVAYDTKQPNVLLAWDASRPYADLQLPTDYEEYDQLELWVASARNNTETSERFDIDMLASINPSYTFGVNQQSEYTWTTATRTFRRVRQEINLWLYAKLT